MTPASITPIIPEVGYLGTGEVYLSPSRSIAGRVHIVVKLDQGGFACSCPATGECFHIRRVKSLTEGVPA